MAVGENGLVVFWCRSVFVGLTDLCFYFNCYYLGQYRSNKIPIYTFLAIHLYPRIVYI